MARNPDDLDRLALRLVAVDRNTAAATKQALRRWAASKKATARVYAALRFADKLDEALDGTTVRNAPGGRRSPARGTKRPRTTESTSG